MSRTVNTQGESAAAAAQGLRELSDDWSTDQEVF